MNLKTFVTRRQKLFEKIGSERAAILFGASESLRNGDVHYLFRQNSDFYYFTGLSEPDAVAVFLPDRKEGEFVLFTRARDPLLERWIGPCTGQEGACQEYGADQAFDIKSLDQKILELLAGRHTLFYALGQNKIWNRKVSHWIDKLKTQRHTNAAPSTLSDISKITSEMRLIKSEEEIAHLRRAAQISAKAHVELMKACRAKMSEFELEALFEYEVKKNGCRSLAYPTIVGGGSNACILHYVDNNSVLREQDLVLIDAGGEYENYAADITRTYPVSGKFNENQATIYALVLKAQLAVIDAIKPGLRWNELAGIATKILTQGLIELGIIKSSLDEALEKKDYAQYYMHTIGHWLGLDVHDAGAYILKGESRELRAGMVLTVEPGLYLSANDSLDSKWWNIGIRIEDDVLVTANGCEVLTHDVPKEINEIEALMTASQGK